MVAERLTTRYTIDDDLTVVALEYKVPYPSPQGYRNPANTLVAGPRLLARAHHAIRQFRRVENESDCRSLARSHLGHEQGQD